MSGLLILLAPVVATSGFLNGGQDDPQQEPEEPSIRQYLGGAAILSVETLLTRWDDDLALENGLGFGLHLFVGIEMTYHCDTCRYQRVSGYPRIGYYFGVRFWDTEDRRAEGEADVSTYDIFGIWFGGRSPQGLTFSGSVSIGVTKFDSSVPGGDSDVAPSFSVNFLDVRMQGARQVWLGAGVAADVAKTNFNQSRTRTIANLSATVSLEVSF